MVPVANGRLVVEEVTTTTNSKLGIENRMKQQIKTMSHLIT